jgi:hypothetical protein
MKMHHVLSVLLAILFAGCSSGRFSSSVKSVGVNTTPKREIVVLGPDKANIFNTMAREHNGWVQTQLRTSINRELAQTERFQPAKGAEDGQIIFNSLRHGLLEVSANNYAAQITADITLMAANGKVVGNREITSTGGNIHTLSDFEDPKVYEEAITAAVDKLALELVTDL